LPKDNGRKPVKDPETEQTADWKRLEPSTYKQESTVSLQQTTKETVFAAKVSSLVSHKHSLNPFKTVI
jgi:hypothetical protein